MEILARNLGDIPVHKNILVVVFGEARPSPYLILYLQDIYKELYHTDHLTLSVFTYSSRHISV